MAILKTEIHISIASMMVASLSSSPKSQIDFSIDEILRLLPSGSTLIRVYEKQGVQVNLYRTFYVELDCPFFQKDFEFEVEFHREMLTDGVVMHQYRMATKIIPLP